LLLPLGAAIAATAVTVHLLVAALVATASVRLLVAALVA